MLPLQWTWQMPVNGSWRAIGEMLENHQPPCAVSYCQSGAWQPHNPLPHRKEAVALGPATADLEALQPSLITISQ